MNFLNILVPCFRHIKFIVTVKNVLPSHSQSLEFHVVENGKEIYRKAWDTCEAVVLLSKHIVVVVMLCLFVLFLLFSFQFLDIPLPSERERHLTTGRRAVRTKLDFRCPICRCVIGQASCLICARRRQLTFPFCCYWNQPSFVRPPLG